MEILTSYSHGINLYLQHKWFLPLEFYIYHGNFMKALFWEEIEIEEWHPIHTLSILRMQALENNQGLEQEYTRALLVETLGQTEADVLLSDANGSEDTIVGNSCATTAASNKKSPYSVESVTHADGTVHKVGLLSTNSGSMFALPASMTSTGNSILASDIQTPMDGSYNRWYMNELRWKEDGDSSKKSAFGASLPGVPLLMFGHNENYAWSLTASNVDSEDLYVMEMDTDDSQELPIYYFKRHKKYLSKTIDKNMVKDYKEDQNYVWVRANVTREVIQVSGKGPNEAVNVIETPQGPLITKLMLPVSVGFEQKYSFLFPEADVESGSGSTVTGIRNSKLALSSQALREPVDIGFVLKMTLGQSWTDFVDACASERASFYNVFSIRFLFFRRT